MIAYQHATPSAFTVSGSPGLEGVYVDGVSLTHGAEGSRQHIWTFAAALYKTGPDARYVCPCTSGFETPQFVGDDYFCEAGNPGPASGSTTYSDNPLWDGEGCGPTSTCCDVNNPPWFCTTLPRSGPQLTILK